MGPDHGHPVAPVRGVGDGRDQDIDLAPPEFILPFGGEQALEF